MNDEIKIDEVLLDTALRILEQDGLEGLTLDRVAAAAGLSRVTLWRQGVTRERLLEGLLSRLSAGYRAALWPILIAQGTGQARLEQAFAALCDVADQHLPLLAATDTAFHDAHILDHTDFTEPFERLLLDGIRDGTLKQIDVAETASILFNCIWTYIHLRVQHQWPPRRAQALLLTIFMHGLAVPDKKTGE